MGNRLNTITVVGAGAVGSFYGAMLARAGHRVHLVARAAHAQAIAARGLQLEMGGRTEAIAIDAGIDLGAVADADLVLVCVKSTDTDDVARAIAPRLRPDAIVASLQNGVDNAQTLARHADRLVVPVAVYVAVAMPEPGVVRHFGRGDLVVGALERGAAAGDAAAGRLHEFVELFGGAGIAVRISDDVQGELWSKLMVNCAYNAISALAQQPYGRLAAVEPIRDVQRAVVAEVVAVANAAGHAMALEPSLAAMERIAAAMPGQLSSTAQDVARGKRSEIDHLNGYVARRGAELGVATPVNQTLHALVKLVEAAREPG